MNAEGKIKEIVQAEAQDNRITCGKMHELSKKHGVSLAELGKAADELKIKIAQCELGCF
ncbi:hypothetical protein [Candidatus Contubernalis alkaliaceticus]|uniref:hypothetical protein n=1 Tax=Candidatus Contubernalis alkaliaceticus TaxID=338645 RepID=UPI001F4BD144|nr:hypothetical protein [Candidatus Contubernalis alkalaceticus]UNC91500.1 hypothetical protein HUE98_04995 [Candidatus Contubernalis alkalaceticus]